MRLGSRGRTREGNNSSSNNHDEAATGAAIAVMVPIDHQRPPHPTPPHPTPLRAPLALQAKEWEKQQRRLAALKKGGQSKGKAEETVSRACFAFCLCHAFVGSEESTNPSCVSPSRVSPSGAGWVLVD